MTEVLAPTLRVGTRGSRLARVQTGLVADRLRAAGAAVETVTIETEGDRRAADTPWGEGAFVTAIEAALLDGTIDVAVHSAKDIPTDEDPRLTIAAFLPRERPEDVLVVPRGMTVGSLGDLPAGSRVGTDSPRRTAFLRALRPDLRVHPLHGNVDTRLRRLDDGETDALVLAAAGLRRLGREDRIAAWLAPTQVPPAPGQGALAVQVRRGDAAVAVVASLDDPETRRAVLAERRLLAAAGGGCRAPLGAFATQEGRGLRIIAGVATPDGRLTARVDALLEGDDPRPVLLQLATTAAAEAAAAGRPRVVVTREADRAASTVLALVDRGFAPVVVPAIETRSTIDDPWSRATLIDGLERADWIVVTSATAIPILQEALTVGRGSLADLRARWAAVGTATATALEAAGVHVSFRPRAATGQELAATLPVRPGDRVLLPRGERADREVLAMLADRGAIVEPVAVYATAVAPAASRPLVTAALVDDHAPVAVVAASPSALEGWLLLADAADRTAVARRLPILAIGPTTAAAARRAGLTVLAEAATPAPGAVADALRSAIDRTPSTPLPTTPSDPPEDPA